MVCIYPCLSAITDGGTASCLDYRETAAKFQKEWHVQAPHRHFDFAPHVKNYALVSVLNKGFVYEDLERKYAESQVRSRISLCCASGVALSAHATVFGWVAVCQGVLTFLGLGAS